MIEEMEDRGEIIVIRPERPVEVDRMERNTKKLLSLYQEGYDLMKSQIDKSM
jgi:predicted patatin/cPLA2 family phospholipase